MIEKNTLEYALGDAAWTPYTAPVAVTADTASELRYRATDKAGNVSAGTLPVKVDTVAPTAAATITPIINPLSLVPEKRTTVCPSF